MSKLQVDSVDEVTSANGVTIDGLNIKDSKLTTANSVVTTNITDANVTTAKIADDAVTTDKLANSINSAITANTAKVTNATHSGEVTGATALTIADNAVTLAKMASGTDGNIISYDASGNPVAVATGSAGQILTSAGAGAPPTFAAAAAGGMLGWGVVTLDGDLALNSSGTQYINSNQTARFLSKSNFISVSSGVISFLETGWYKIDYQISMARVSDNGEYVRGIISRSTNGGSSFSDLAYSYSSVDSAAQEANQYLSAIIDIESTSAYKIAMGFAPENASRCRFFGTGMPVTAMFFTKLAER